MRSDKLIQGGVALVTLGIALGVTKLAVYYVMKDNELHADFVMGAFSDIHAESLYDPNTSNEQYCKRKHSGPL